MLRFSNPTVCNDRLITIGYSTVQFESKTFDNRLDRKARPADRVGHFAILVAPKPVQRAQGHRPKLKFRQ